MTFCSYDFVSPFVLLVNDLASIFHEIGDRITF